MWGGGGQNSPWPARKVADFKNLFLGLLVKAQKGLFSHGIFKRENGPLRVENGSLRKQAIKANGLFSGTPTMVENGPSKKAH